MPWKRTLFSTCILAALLLSLAPSLTLAQTGSDPKVDAVVLVNSDSTDYSDFEHFIQPYLDHFGIPYTLLDIATAGVGAEIGDYAVIIVGHRQLDPGDIYLDATEEGYISAAVSAGTGLVNFDNDLSVGGTTPRYQFIEDIFEFGYLPPSTGSGVTFTSETGGGLQINCWEDDHQDPVLTTFTNAGLFDDTDGEWDEFLWLGNRDYPGVFAGIPEATGDTLETFHCFGDVPNGTYDVIANLYHSRDWRYFWGYTAGAPRTNSYDVTSGPAGDFAEFEIDTITITDGSFDIYMNYGEDLGGTAFEYFGWSWIRLVPTSAPPPVMHYITERHTAGENIGTGGMTMAGITLPEGVTALAMAGSQPFLAVAEHGAGHAVQWGSYDWMSHAVKGPVYGLDDLVWRSIVWAARKPFVMQGLPNFVTMRVDDESGPFGWIEIANEFGIKPWAGLFYYNVDSAEAAQLSTLVNAGQATASVHAKSGAFFYYDHSNEYLLEGNFPDEIVAANFAHATAWHNDNNIPISKFVLPHYYEFGTNVFQGLSDWGVEFVGTMMNPGNGYGAPWIMNGPYRLYETGGSSGGRPVYYADFMDIPDFDEQFFNCVTEIRDDAGYEWYPSSDVAGSIGRGTRQTIRALDSMALATLFTHGYFLPGIPTDSWRAILQGITDNLAEYDPIYVTMDHACQYVRAMHTSDITDGSYDPVERRVTAELSGETDMDTMFYLFTEQAGDIHQQLIDVPTFSGATTVVYTLAGPLDHIVVSPASATVATGGTQQFTAQGYDADDNPIPNLPFTWTVSGGGTIDGNGLFTAGLMPGAYVVDASFGGVSGFASVEVVAPALHHFTFEPVAGPQYVDAPFQVTITARDISGNPLAGYFGMAALSDSTGTLDPSTTGSFDAGVWTGEVTVGQVAHDVILTATDGDASGTSEPFEVLPMPMFYQVASPAYEYLEDEAFPVTVTAYEGTTINLWEDEHQDPDLVTTSDATLLESTPGEWTEFKYGTRPFPSVMAAHNEYEDSSLPLMHFSASGIPNGEYEVIANLYDNAPMRCFYGFTPGDPLAQQVDTLGGASGTQHREYSLGTVPITDGTFNLYVQDANLLPGGSTYPIFGWAWVRLVPVESDDVTIDCSDDGHQDPVLPTTELVADLVPTDGEWTEFLWTSSRPYPSILAAVDEYEEHDLPMMRFYASDIPNGEYEVFANLYDNASMRYFYGFTAGDPLAQQVDTLGGASGTQHREYSLGTVAITDGTFDLYVQDANLLPGGSTYPFFGWAWIRLASAGLQMSSSSPTMLFDGDGNGIFGEPGDDVKPLVDGSLTIMARDSDAGSGVEIRATDASGRFGYNMYTIQSINQPPVADAGGPYTYIFEGDSVTLDASASSDPDDNIVLYEWDLDNDGEYDDATGITTDVVFDDDGAFTVGLRVTDFYGESDIDTADVTVDNVAPTVDAGAAQTVNEGTTVNLDTATFDDPGTADTHTATIDWGDGSLPEAGVVTESDGSGTVEGSHVYADDGTYAVQVCVTDDDLAETCDILYVTVDNVAPTVDAGADQTVDEGTTVVLAPATFADPGTADTHTATIDWGDGSLPEDGAVTESDGSGTVAGSHVYADDGTFAVNVCVTDDDLAETCDILYVTVDNVAPVVTVDIDTQDVQYSDNIREVTFAATDVAADTITAAATPAPLPNSLVLTDQGCTDDGLWQECSWTLSGVVDVMEEIYDITLTVSDGEREASIATRIVVIEETTVLSVDDATVQYSDSVELSATLTDDDGTPLEEGTTLSFEVPDACSGEGTTDKNGVATFTCGPVPLFAGEYDIIVSYVGEAGYYKPASGTGTLTVQPEEVRISFHGGNPVAVRVLEDGGPSGWFDLMVRVREAYDPETDTEPSGEPRAYPGDIGLAEVTMQLIPVGPGSPADPVPESCTSSTADTGYDAKETVVCGFDSVLVNTYAFSVTVGGGYYAGGSEDALVVYDPSLGYASGGGSFEWPETDEPTKIVFTMKYNKKGKNLQGSLLLIRHVGHESRYQVKSNALYGLALGQDSDWGWASFSGKSTYLEPDWPEPIGNHEFVVYVEDRNEPGTGVDRFWIEVHDKDGIVIPAMSMPRDAPKNAVEIDDGNVVVPH
jgi:hypothetical protein